MPVLTHPLALLLLVLPLAVRMLPPRTAAGLALALPPGIAAAARPVAPARVIGPAPAALGLWVCLVLALSGPVRLTTEPDRSASGRDIMLAIDLSGSMAIEDFTVDGITTTRLAAVKRVASAFVAARRGDRIGLVIFADRAYVAAPLTHDLAAVMRAIETAEIGLTGRSTAIADGLGLALKRILADPATARTIVLLSDGKDTAARLEATDVARLASDNAVRIHTIALGPADLETTPAARDAVDTATLRAIALQSGGESFRVRDTADLVAMAAELDRLEPNPSLRPPVVVRAALWHWVAAAALLPALLVAWRRE